MTIGKLLIRGGSSLTLATMVGLFIAADYQHGLISGIALDLWCGTIVAVGIWYPYELKD